MTLLPPELGSRWSRRYVSMRHSGSVRTVSILFVRELSMAFAYASLDGWTACESRGMCARSCFKMSAVGVAM